MKSLKSYTKFAAFIGTLAAVGASAQVTTINSANIQPRFFNDMPGAVVNVNNSYPGSITIGESNVTRTNTGGLNRAVWYFSNNGGVSPYQFTSGNYFRATFGVTLTGGTTGIDLEAGFIFSNPSGVFGGDCQLLVVGQGGNAGTVVQFGGPSYYPFSPAAGGFPGKGGSVPNYVNGATYTLEFDYRQDPVTGKDAFQYAVNGQYAANSSGSSFFDLGGPVGSPGDYLGGYFQIGNHQNDPSNGGQGVFSNISIVPEPSALALLALGGLPLLLRRRNN